MRLRKWIGSPAGWRTLGLAAVLLVLGWGCETSYSPVDPSPQDPGPSPQNPGNASPHPTGALEVSVGTSGTRPDPDGFTVSLSVGNGAQHGQTVGPEGGTVRFPDLPAGRHSVRLDSLAPNCSVLGLNPRLFDLTANETFQVSFAVSCPGPGAVLVKTITTGSDLDSDGYTLTFWSSSGMKDIAIGATRYGSVRRPCLLMTKGGSQDR